MKKVISVCQTQTFTVILSLLILMIGFGFSAHAAKLGLASAWLFEDNGGKTVKDIVSGHDGEIKGTLAATGLFDEVGFFTEALSKDELNDVMDSGLAVYAAVDAAGKATTTWALLKTTR